uniref:hypothetical protein n=1 Tax=Ahnfeltia fastigiata TaxID=31363 RepID=UPI001D122637|nr:hypothetical protein LK038_pgp196 [Ahnfeltia fastigiata]UAT97654.1 hypothetical protein Ahn.fas.Ore.pt_015 [Ahnfeltia fastigiata]
MVKTSIQFLIRFISESFRSALSSQLNNLSTQLISLLLGFFIATAISTMPAQTGDWGIIAAAIIVTINEIISKLTYQNKSISKRYDYTILLYKSLNSIKIGIIYGLFVDAFKLGS